MSQSTPVRHRSPSLQRAFARVGEPEAEFRSRSVLPLAIVLGGLSLLAGGVVALWWVVPLALHGFPAIGGVTVMLPVLGLMAIVYGWRIWGERWFVCPGGVVRRHGSTAEACAWADFLSIGQSSDRGTYWLRRKDGAAWHFSAANVPEVSELGRLIRLKSEAHGITWEVGKS